MQPVFQRRNLASLLPKIVLAGHNMLSRWRQLGDGAELNLSNEMMRLTLEVITQTMFSTTVLDKIEHIAPALDTVLRYAAKTVINPLQLVSRFRKPDDFIGYPWDFSETGLIGCKMAFKCRSNNIIIALGLRRQHTVDFGFNFSRCYV